MGCKHWKWELNIFLIAVFLSGISCQCSKQDYQYCVKLADPLLKDPHLIYPDNPHDIEHVCRTWSFFVDCVKVYTERCFSESKRQEFNKAVESPVNSIHRLCSMPDYRADYMKHASCMKMTLTQDNHCGKHYKVLVSQVSGEAPASSICCSHHLFRECVIDQTRMECAPEAEAFSAQVLDKALSFLRNQCSNYVPNKYDCPGADFYKLGVTGRSDKSTTLSDQQHTAESKHGASSNIVTGQSQAMPSRTTVTASTVTVASTTSTTNTHHPWAPSTNVDRGSSSRWSKQPDWTSPSWMPGGNKGRTTNSNGGGPNMADMGNDSANSAERTTFSRGMSWEDGKGTTRPPPYTWFPSSKANDYKETNAIDEPNQQGLGSPENGALSLILAPLTLFISLALSLSIR